MTIIDTIMDLADAYRTANWNERDARRATLQAAINHLINPPAAPQRKQPTGRLYSQIAINANK